ncbi:MAG: L-seryl-tRNA(Sec) selenium transferase [Proteobacteria bacterium]|nr:L-seryl-tRNA(Sec) selenium transferase [Pseudomonadota bacterium]
MKTAFSQIPSVDRLLISPHFEALSRESSRERVASTLRAVLAELRCKLEKDEKINLSGEHVADLVALKIAEEDAPSLKRVINATGTVIHTNLGRSVLPEEAVEAVVAAARYPLSLEYDLAKGKRGDRDSHLEGLICRLTGAEAATVVNNNAAAVLLTLNSLARRKEVLVSRGELVEIGGSFRIPEIISASGCKMHELGTTNRTRIDDYKDVLSAKTGAILKVHTSNYRVVGFTEETGLAALAKLVKDKNIPVIEDLGSGALADLSSFGLTREPLVEESLRKGVDIVTFSGDKLLGGPQAGIIAGRKDLIKRIKKNQLKRALRVDKLTIAALAALLKLYLNRDTFCEKIPTLRFLARPLVELEALAKLAAEGLEDYFGGDATVDVEAGSSQIGSGALPGEEIPSKLIVIRHKSLTPSRLAASFRKASPPIIGRVKENSFILDVRCVERAKDLLPRKKLKT